MELSPEQSPRWMTHALRAAGAYNLLWGALVVLFPAALFDWAGMAQPYYPELWQCIGMLVGAYGVAYLGAAGNPIRHWPVVAAGFIGKVLGPLGFLQAASSGRFSWRMGWVIVANDLIWWVPFGLVLIAAYRAHLGQRRTASPEIQRMALRARTQFGVSLEELSRLSPILLVFLRQTGCTFCREALADLARQRAEIEASGVRIVLVHMSPESHAGSFFRRYGLEDLPRVSDPRRTLYRAFGLARGGLMRLFGPKVWVRGFQAALLGRHGIGRLVGDGFQMPGVFLIFHGEVLSSYRHHTAADRPDYLSMARQTSGPAGIRCD